MNSHRLRVWIVGCACASMVGTMIGCNVASTVAAVTRPDPVVEAKYHLANVPTVILFDDNYSIVTPVRLRREIAEEATIVLMEKADMAGMISPLDAIRLARQLDQPSVPAAIHEVGAGVGADQVIYVQPMQFFVPSLAGVADPRASFRIKVIDVKTRARLWPSDDEGGSNGWPLHVSLLRDEAVKLAAESGSAVKRGLGTKCGDEIARLFIDTEYSQHGNRLLGQ